MQKISYNTSNQSGVKTLNNQGEKDTYHGCGLLKRTAFLLPLTVASCMAMSVISTQAVADSVGPAVVAKADNHLWHGAIDDPQSFDEASRASILVYVLALQDLQKLTDAEMLDSFKIKSINRESVEKWLAKEFGRSLLNYQRASKSCSSNDWSCVGQVSTTEDILKKASETTSRVPHDLLPWRENLSDFAHNYVAEQLRLAALFPKVTSEIGLFNSNEWNGDDLPDRQFFLTFDDGPTTPHSTSDETLSMLAAENKNAIFFVLGENFQGRLNKTDAASVSELYKNQCVASHGWQHKSHAKWEQWQDSIKNTQALLNSTLPKNSVVSLFRPPYGQRKDDSSTFFQSQSLHVALWNLDSQDWNSHVDVNDIVNRMITLMLIKRHGVLLFHDVHPKAEVALPKIFKVLGNAVEWGNCHQLALM